MIRYRKELKIPARQLRSSMTAAERHLWQRLRRRQVGGVRFYRQKPLLDFIVDFYAPTARLVVEVDGGHHAEDPAQVERDAERDEILEQVGLTVLRFTNEAVMRDVDGVVAEIEAVVVAG